MDFSLPADLWSSVVPISLAVGALGGFGWDVGNAIRASSKEPTTGIDNVIELPHSYPKTGGGYAIDLGFLGPMFVGALAGVLLVLLVGPSAPSAEEAAKALVTASTTAQSPSNGAGQGAEALAPAEATEAVEEKLPSSIPEAQLVLLALLGGLGGWALLQTLTTKMSSVFEAAVGNSVKAAGEAAEKKVLAEAEGAGIADPAKQQDLAEKAGSAALQAGSAALQQEPATGSG